MSTSEEHINAEILKIEAEIKVVDAERKVVDAERKDNQIKLEATANDGLRNYYIEINKGLMESINTMNLRVNTLTDSRNLWITKMPLMPSQG